MTYCRYYNNYIDSIQLQEDLNLFKIWSIDTNLLCSVFKIFRMSFKAQFILLDPVLYLVIRPRNNDFLQFIIMGSLL